ncbi:hypothetical protein F5972_30650 [Microbispora cellulosiformans]|uniref:Uncharacterized protein n=1 Tax=Microbispora cellulosiformans TaxID=2614688 RepID=A0A5J5JWD0_9ACTN|nr:hypothetical protein [Microbispora cellulosiformans]KAA9374603.1 hypothetical protein F5972_30650 [Microbispora cellulosiformans]
MSSPDTTGWNDSARDASLSHLPDHIRRAIEITPAAGTSERIIGITTLGRHTGRPRRIEIFFYRAAGTTVPAEIVADLNQPHDPGTIRPTRLEDWADRTPCPT